MFVQAASFLLLAFISCASAGRIFILDDGEDGEKPLNTENILNLILDLSQSQNMKTGVVHHRVRRDAPPYGPPAPAPYHPAPHHGPKGRVGPVYTFVKTDPQVIR